VSSNRRKRGSLGGSWKGQGLPVETGTTKGRGCDERKLHKRKRKKSKKYKTGEQEQLLDEGGKKRGEVR